MPEAYSPVSVEHTPPVSVEHTQKQTLKTKQTEESSVDPVLEELRFSVGEKTFDRFMNGAKLRGIEEGIAVIETPYSYAKDFIENRLGDKISRALGVSTVRCVVMTED